MIAITGHRPDKLGGYAGDARLRLVRFARSMLEYRRPSGVITGMALGWDQAVAAACVDLQIPFLAFLPFPPSAHASRWPAEARDLYYALLSEADMVVPCSDDVPVSHQHASRLMQRRNERMVDHADHGVEALWDGTAGGTFNCIEYARRRGVVVRNHWAVWSSSESQWPAMFDILG